MSASTRRITFWHVLLSGWLIVAGAALVSGCTDAPLAPDYRECLAPDTIPTTNEAQTDTIPVVITICVIPVPGGGR